MCDFNVQYITLCIGDEKQDIRSINCLLLLFYCFHFGLDLLLFSERERRSLETVTGGIYDIPCAVTHCVRYSIVLFCGRDIVRNEARKCQFKGDYLPLMGFLVLFSLSRQKMILGNK